jgi:copper homeostasis protein
LPFLLEICVDSVESAVTAESAGARRIELCSALSEGGITPSAGLIESVRSNTGIKIHILIRPRGGDFLYNESEFSVMRRDIEIAGEKGADGIVTGILKNDGTVDLERTALLTEYAAPMSVTFHRAFDLCRDAHKAVGDIISAGASRILTSGQAQTAIEGAQLIKKLVDAAGKSIMIMPGGGIDEYNIALLAGITGACEYHLSARRQTDSAMTFRRKEIYMGDSRLMSEYIIKSADGERIRTINGILRDMLF